MSLQEFFYMNGYAPYVWGSYGMGLVVFLGLFLSMRNQRNKLFKQIRRKTRQAEKHRETGTEQSDQYPMDFEMHVGGKRETNSHGANLNS